MGRMVREMKYELRTGVLRTMHHMKSDKLWALVVWMVGQDRQRAHCFG